MSSKPPPRGASLHLGLNRVDPKHYAGWSGALGACEADARGRPGFEHVERPETTVFRQVYTAACAVTAKDVVAAGFAGAQIREELHRRRVHAIAATLGRSPEEGEV